MISVDEARKPSNNRFKKLDSEYRQYDKISDSKSRLFHEAEKLEEMKNLKEQLRGDIINIVPKLFKHRAKALLSQIEPFIEYDDKKQLLNILQKKRYVLKEPSATQIL